MSAGKPTSANKGEDMLLWIAGGAIAAVGTAWLLITQPWTNNDVDVPDAALTQAPMVLAAASPALTTEVEAAAGDAAALAPDATLDNPLRMAELAYEAGMLIEPEEFSAWTLFAGVLKIGAGQCWRPATV